MISWWWDGRGTKADPDSLLDFVTAHRSIVSSVQLNCGVTVGEQGTLIGNVTDACSDAIPRLLELGVVPEHWIGSGSSSNVTWHHRLFDQVDAAADVLLRLGSMHQFAGVNVDLEPKDSTSADAEPFSAFLASLRPRLNAAGMRLTVDASASGWCPMIADVALLATAVDRVLNMRTYHGSSWGQWLDIYTPFIESAPRDSLGVGLACYVNDKTNGTWEVLAESAEQRVCQLMNDSVVEVDMFRIYPEASWPEEFWIEPLNKFMAGGGCEPDPRPVGQCPEGFAGPDANNCCEKHYSADCPADCAKERCEAFKDWEWQDLDFHHNPYTCCAPASLPSMQTMILA